MVFKACLQKTTQKGCEDNMRLTRKSTEMRKKCG